MLHWAKNQGIPDLFTAEKLHVTVAYSRKPIDYEKAGSGIFDVEVVFGDREIARLGRSAIALKFKSSVLSARFDAIRKAGATWDYPSYIPHLTVAESLKPIKLANVVPYYGILEFGPEIIEKIESK